jgi:hypothetical protein
MVLMIENTMIDRKLQNIGTIRRYSTDSGKLSGDFSRNSGVSTEYMFRPCLALGFWFSWNVIGVFD